MNSFNSVFIKLKTERGLSNKQIASFTGVTQKEVKKWESGVSFPTDYKILNALEGLLGTEITKSLKNFEQHAQNKIETKIIEEDIFKVNKEQISVKNTKIDSLRTSLKRKNSNSNKTNDLYENKVDDTFISNYQDQPNKLLNFDDSEAPYIQDVNQVGFYFTRNIKTFAMLSLFLLIIITSFNLFWDSIRLIIDALF
jgi:transcriptional regulator with XRE-family HTH domain